jgi:hypothetical protein
MVAASQCRADNNAMKLALAILAAVLLLAGCGHANAPQDPFVGTWRDKGFRIGAAVYDKKLGAFTLGTHPTLAELVITKQANRYHATLAVWHDWPFGQRDMFLTRHGNRLVGSIYTYSPTANGSRQYYVVLTYLLTTGRLTFREATSPTGHLAKPDGFSWVSASSVVPVATR